MFGGVSNPDLSDPMMSPRKTYYDRELPSGFTEGGLGIGEGGSDSKAGRKQQMAAKYRAQLAADAHQHGGSDQLPDAKKRTAYDFVKTATDPEHPLGVSNMNALGEKKLSSMDEVKQARARQKREELSLNRYDIISCLEEGTKPENSPRARNAANLLIGMPIPGRTDDGIMNIGRTADEEKADKRRKQAELMAQLNADTGVKFGLDDNYDPQKDSLNTYKSHARIETTGSTGFNVGSGRSLDMSLSMKELDFKAKRKAQQAYRDVLTKQQADKAEFMATVTARDAADDGCTLPYMQSPSK